MINFLLLPEKCNWIQEWHSFGSEALAGGTPFETGLTITQSLLIQSPIAPAGCKICFEAADWLQCAEQQLEFLGKKF